MYIIRPITLTDENFLWQMLYEAAHLSAENKTIQDAMNHPELRKYVENWGQKSDLGFVAALAKNYQPVGAAWLRLFTGNNQGYGYINDQIPELAIAVLPEYRNQGIGTQLLTHLINAAKTNYPAISLSSRSSNPALNLYQRFGWQVIEGSEKINRVEGISLTMKLNLQ
ncbi:MAG TPA: GNAT family N-acetyltransferase [Nostocaceae cyanobacterium]|nr:GNAT family N-acetyltransferase [Nostocaceae cyanobacterium]